MSTRNDSITPLPARAGVHGTDGHAFSIHSSW